MTNKLKKQLSSVSKAIKLRADYLFYIMKEMDESGFLNGDEILKRAIYKIGKARAKGLKAVRSPREFHDALSKEDSYEIYKVEIKREEEGEVELHFGNCPLVERWKELNLDAATVKRLCLIANQIDYGKIEDLGLDLKMKARLGEGDDKCVMIINKANPYKGISSTS